MDAVGPRSDVARFRGNNGPATWVFNSALGELRGVFGIHVARLAAAHGLDVEDDLAAILPGKDDDDERTIEDEYALR